MTIREEEKKKESKKLHKPRARFEEEEDKAKTNIP